MHTRSGTLEAVQPFDFGKSLLFLQGFGPMGGEQSVSDGQVTKAMMVDGQTVVFRVKEDGPRLRYELLSAEPLDEAVADSVAQRISFFLSLDDNVDPFYSIAKEHDPKFYPLVERSWGLHQVKFLTLLEISCWALINQRMQRPIALRIKRSLTERFGGSLEVDGVVHWAFPDRSRLEDVTAKQLLETTKNQRVAQRLVSLVSSLDEMDEKFLRTSPYEKANERLQKVKGIGDWSSQFILFRGLGRMGKLQPINVRPLGEAIESVYGPEGRETLDEVNRIYGDRAGYWLLYLWASTMGQKDGSN
ncbi:MAG: hypothetical protein OK455_01575 [Thaumarchaeota archaeon]|nr:hypothetical protein [Nitrososphaerota archaeon]